MKNWGKSTDPMKNWPLQDDGTPVRPVYLCNESSLSFSAEVAVSMLNAYGIPVMTQHPSGGSMGKVVLGISGYGQELYVPETMLDTARDLISDDVEILEEEMYESLDSPSDR